MNKQYPVSVGIIGYGSMGSALATAIADAQSLQQRFSLRVYAKSGPPEAGARGIVFARSLQEIVCNSDIIILAVRPEQVESVLSEIVRERDAASATGPGILVSVAAGITLDLLNSLAAQTFVVIRIMPNTLVEVGKGLFGLCGAKALPEDQKRDVLALFNALGTVIELDESKMNAFTALAGCGPGMLFHIMDAFCEAGVSIGLTREASREISTALMAGCGLLAQGTGRHPVILREQSTSPAGMTIAGLNHLDRSGTRGHLIDAVKTAMEQGEAMDRASMRSGNDNTSCLTKMA